MTRRLTLLALFSAAVLILTYNFSAASGEPINASHSTQKRIYEQFKNVIVYIRVETSGDSKDKPTTPGGIESKLRFPILKYFLAYPTEYVQNIQVGAGFIITPSGEILTNHHVISGATNISVRFPNGDFYLASVVNSDPITDLALLKIESTRSETFPVLNLGDSNFLAVGDQINAIGHPFGLEWTLCKGIISGPIRFRPPLSFIQIQCAINPGNSGGPLFNENGQVIGIVQSVMVQTDNIAFAIPINTAKDRLPILRTPRPQKSEQKEK